MSPAELKEPTIDAKTLDAYNAAAPTFAAQHRQISPEIIYRLITAWFQPDAHTVDVGCGSGRDVHWLAEHGYQVTGFDASPAMLAMAREAYPDVDVRPAALPELAGVESNTYANVLCSAVLMHIPREELITAVLNLARILKPGGRLILSYRGSRGLDEREDDGRLFTAIPLGKLTLLLESAGFQVLLSEEQSDTARTGIQWRQVVAEKSPLSVSRGLERVQSVLVQDRKVATYKLALIRALCVISRTESNLIRWEGETVLVPLWAVAVQWLIFYWPLVTIDGFIAQIRGETPTSPKPVAFRSAITQLAETHGRAGLYEILKQLDEAPLRFRQPLKKIADAIRDGPVTYAGTDVRLFSYAPPPRQASRIEEGFGWVIVPEAVWLDLARFDHWIEDSVILRWARLTAEMNTSELLGVGKYLPLLLQQAGDERDTTEARALLRSATGQLECVWTGKTLAQSYDIDHVIPYSVWGNNDLWNLLPALPAINNSKSAQLPSRELLLRRRDCIIDYWRRYIDGTPERFSVQIERALGGRIRTGNWEAQAFGGLQETIERLAMTRGLSRWEPPQ